MSDDLQKFEQREITIYDYDPAWPELFQKAKEEIITVIGDRDIIIEHIGSTSIPNLAAKAVIDIMVGVDSLEIADECIKPLEALGYTYVSKYEDAFPERRYFNRGPHLPNQHYHLHMVVKDSEFWRKQIFFRDYLRQNKDIAEAYANLKRRLSKKYRAMDYTYAKSDFINDVLAKDK